MGPLVIIRERAGIIVVKEGVRTVSTGQKVLLTLEARFLAGADLQGADLSYADLAGADLRLADLSRAKLYAADLTGADLTDANLQGAECTGCYLTGARLCRARLTHSNLTFAKLEGADLSSSDMVGTIIAFSRYDATTMWPTGLDPVSRRAGPSAGRLRSDKIAQEVQLADEIPSADNEIR